MYDLGENKNQPYEKFIEAIIKKSNEISEKNELKPDDFNQIVYPGKQLIVNMPASSNDAEYNAEEWMTLISKVSNIIGLGHGTQKDYSDTRCIFHMIVKGN